METRFHILGYISRRRIAGSYNNPYPITPYPFKELTDDFSKWLHHFTPLQAVYEGEDFSTSSRAHYYPTENVVIFVGTKWCLIAVLIYISLMTS